MRTLTIWLFAATLALTGCTGSDGSDGTPGPDVSRSFNADEATKQAEKQAEQTKKAQEDLEQRIKDTTFVEITIKGGKATPQGDRVEVKAGKPVTLQITSDADEEIHVHSDPEHTYEVGPGDAISKTFTIKTPGQVAVEAHHLGVTIVQLVVRP